MYKFFVCCTLVLVGAHAAPTLDDLLFEGAQDTATVESVVREARAAPSHIGELVGPGVKDAFLYVYGDVEGDDGDVHGYSKKMKDKGQDGYKHRDSYHKQDGDKYGYEKHSEFGQEQKASIENENDKGLEEASFEAEGGKGEESKKLYAVHEELNEEDKKQPKKKLESDYGFFGDDGGSYYGSESESSDGEAESESSDGDDGAAETEDYEESEEGEEADEEDDY